MIFHLAALVSGVRTYHPGPGGNNCVHHRVADSLELVAVLSPVALLVAALVRTGG